MGDPSFSLKVDVHLSNNASDNWTIMWNIVIEVLCAEVKQLLPNGELVVIRSPSLWKTCPSRSSAGEQSYLIGSCGSCVEQYPDYQESFLIFFWYYCWHYCASVYWPSEKYNREKEKMLTFVVHHSLVLIILHTCTTDSFSQNFREVFPKDQL